LSVIAPVANCTVSPLATPVMLADSAPWNHLSGVPAVSHISIAVMVDQEPVAVQEGALEEAVVPEEFAPKVTAVPPAV
jgi:hypothetical protein